MGQEYLPSRLGLASGITVGAAIGVGGLAAAALGALADETSLETAMWVIALVPLGRGADRVDAAADRARPASWRPRNTKAPQKRGLPCRSWITTELS